MEVLPADRARPEPSQMNKTLAYRETKMAVRNGQEQRIPAFNLLFELAGVEAKQLSTDSLLLLGAVDQEELFVLRPRQVKWTAGHATQQVCARNLRVDG